MKRIKSSLIFVLVMGFVLFVVTSCKHDPEIIGTTLGVPADTSSNGNNNGNNNGNTNGSTCSKDTVYFEQQILPVFQSSCAVSGCHNSITHKEGIILDSYNHIISSGGINTSNPTNSKLYRVMLSTGESRMPPTPYAPITSTQLASISKWIAQGAKNNSCVESGCDTTDVKYSTHILPLIQNNCQGCHSGSAPGGGYNLATYAGVKAIADNGRLFGSISHITGYVAMPQNGNKLTDCQINIVKIWINQGAPDN